MALLDHRGVPFPPAAFKKADPPKLGEAFGGAWNGFDKQFLNLPGGGVVQFNLDNLTLADYRSMTNHYQVNSSLSVLSFMQHQSDWTVECSDPKIAAACQENLEEIWTQLNRGMSQANWSGYSPNVLQWENDPISGTVNLAKIKDLLPETSVVNWKEVPLWAPPGRTPPKTKVYDGIQQFGSGWPVPVDNSFWYPILMENGDYYGRKLLKAAYTSYFFSMLMHLFSNRYYERFGEPVPLGRAPFDDELTLPNGNRQRSNEFMVEQLMNLRNRSVVVLPSDRSEDTAGRGYFDYDLQYLESQMRGADFERYMQRLDEEISLAIFTPVLLMKTADVGSYNLGIGHMQMYLWMLNALNADRKQYIDKFILRPMVDYKFSTRAPDAKINFKKLDNSNAALVQAVLVALIQAGGTGVDLNDLGQMAGLTLKQVKQTVAPQTPAPEPDDKPVSADTADTKDAKSSKNRAFHVAEVKQAILERVNGQVSNAFSRGAFDKTFTLNMGFKRRMAQALVLAGVRDVDSAVDGMFGRLDDWADDTTGSDYYDSAEKFNADFERLLDYEIDRVK